MSYDVLTPDAATLWPHLPSWNAGFNVKRAFSTDIFESRDNTEQRRAIRQDPRFSVEYSVALRGDERVTASRWLRWRQNTPVLIPDFARWSRLTGASGAATSTLDVSPMPPWVEDMQRLVLCGATIEEVQVASVAGTTITLVHPLVGSWPIGSVLRPTFHGLLGGKISSDRLNKAAAILNITLEAYPGGEPARAAGAAWASVGSREVFTQQPDFASSPGIDYLWPVENVDFARGRTAQFRPVTVPQNALDGDFNGLDVTLTAEIEQFFDRMKGRRGAFYLPTGDSDATFVTSAAGSVTVAGTDLATAFAGFDFTNDEFGIAVCLTDGTKLYRRISSITAGGANSVVAVASNWGVALSGVARISLMPLARFASDEMTTSWRTPLLSRIRLAFQTVRR